MSKTLEDRAGLLLYQLTVGGMDPADADDQSIVLEHLRAVQAEERERCARIVDDHAEEYRRQARGIVDAYEGDSGAVREAEGWDRDAARLDRLASAIRDAK